MISPASANSGRKNARRQQLRRKPLADQRFSSYMVFGLAVTMCLSMFLACYVIILLAAWPLIMSQPHFTAEEHPLQLKEVVRKMRFPQKIKDAELKLIDKGKAEIGKVAHVFQKEIDSIRHTHGITDQALLDEAQRKLNVEQMAKQSQRESKRRVQAAIEEGNLIRASRGANNNNLRGGSDTHQRNGFIVLGMHRSGTSMLSGLLATACGYTVGGPLIGQAFDNEKGFFERIDVVLQNDEFMKAQNVWWAHDVVSYDWEKGVKDYETKEITFKQGKKGLAFLNNANNAPWLQKDPRMCITLKTWLKIMNNEPAIVFTYRHPLEVAMSLKKREDDFALERGLRLWIIYNMRAIQNSKGLCMVTSSNEAILADPLTEVQRISDEATSKCHVPAPPRRVTEDDVKKFVDPNLQHNKKRRALDEESLPVIAKYNDGKCIVRDFASDTPEGSPAAKREQRLYGIAMKIYCDFQSGKAYEDAYQWPEL